MYTTAYYSKADWNDTRFFNEKFDQMLLAARSELDEAKRKQMYADMGMLVRDEGGLILPMFNDFIDASGAKAGGFNPHPAGEMMDGYALAECWLSA